jgi:hypothetical protein
VPFGYHQIDPIKTSLIAAGFDEVTAHVLKITKEIPKAQRLAEGLVLGNPVIEEIRTSGACDPASVVAAVTAALHGAFGRDPGRMQLQAIVFSARKH